MASYLQALRVLPSYSCLPMQILCMDGVQGDFLCRPATATTDVPIGVSQQGYDVAPNLINAISSGTATYTPVAAVPGEELQIFSVGDIAPVVLGASVSSGSLIGANTFGYAVGIVQGSGNYYCGIAQQSGASGGVINILIQPGKA